MKEYLDVLQKISDGSDEGDLLLRRLNKELSLLNIPFPTLGGELFWSNEVRVNGWKLQKNDFIDYVRLLNAQNICVAWGTESGMKHALKKVARYAETNRPKKENDDYTENIEKLKRLKELLDIGAITEEEFNEKKKAILEKM